MTSLDDKKIRDALRKVLDSAAEKGYLSVQEAAFTNMLFDRLDREVEQKTKEFIRLDGQIKQLRLTKQVVIDMIKDSIAARERAEAREETYNRLREGRAARETLVIEEEEKEEKKAPAKRKTTKKKTTAKTARRKKTKE
jgi:hypothetical protein